MSDLDDKNGWEWPSGEYDFGDELQRRSAGAAGRTAANAQGAQGAQQGSYGMSERISRMQMSGQQQANRQARAQGYAQGYPQGYSQDYAQGRPQQRSQGAQMGYRQGSQMGSQQRAQYPQYQQGARQHAQGRPVTNEEEWNRARQAQVREGRAQQQAARQQAGRQARQGQVRRQTPQQMQQQARQQQAGYGYGQGRGNAQQGRATGGQGYGQQGRYPQGQYPQGQRHARQGQYPQYPQQAQQAGQRQVQRQYPPQQAQRPQQGYPQQAGYPQRPQQYQQQYQQQQYPQQRQMRQQQHPSQYPQQRQQQHYQYPQQQAAQNRAAQSAHAAQQQVASAQDRQEAQRNMHYLESLKAQEQYDERARADEQPVDEQPVAARPITSKAKRKPVTRRTFMKVGIAAGIAVVAGLGVRQYLNTRPISCTVNGAQLTLDSGTTYADLVSSGKLAISSGNLMAVDGTTVLTRGGGNPYHVYADDVEVDANEVVKRDAVITGANGEDVTEDYTVSETTTAWELDMSGTGAIVQRTQDGADGITYMHKGAVSGIEVEGEESVPAQNMVVEGYNVKPTEKLIAITFDDGPTSYTPTYLDILKEYGAKATFFTLGEQVESMPEYTKRAYEEGHQIATHSYSHPNFYTISGEEVREELEKGYAAIKDALGIDVRVARAPYGNWKSDQWAAAGDLVDTLVIWNIDSLDWELLGTETLINTVVGEASSGAIILMHDGGGNRDQDVEALPSIISQLQGQGYTFVTIDELIAAEGEHKSLT